MLKINGIEFKDLREAYNSYEKLSDEMSVYLAEYNQFDDEGEVIPKEYTDDELSEALWKYFDSNPIVAKISFNIEGDL